MPDVLDAHPTAPPAVAAEPSEASPAAKPAESLIGSLLRQAQQHQQLQQQQALQQNAIAANSCAASATSDAMVDEPVADTNGSSNGSSGSGSNGHGSVASPVAGPLARALSIPSFQHNNGGSPYKQPAAAASSSAASAAMTDSASAASAVYTPSPSKRSKFHDRASPSHGASVASPLLAGALGALPPPSLGGGGSEPTTPEQPARTLSANGSKEQGSSGHTMLGMMQGGATPQHSSPGSGSLQKRRNSGTAALHLTAAPLASSMHNGPSLSASARKPPAYPAGPSNPSTPSMLGRSLPINIGSGSRRNSSHSSGMLPAPMSGGAGAGSGHLSPSQTPPGTPQLPIPRSMLPQSPLTPALGPDRSIPVINAQGQLQRVNSQQMSSYMNNVEEVVLPPQAAPDQQHGQSASSSSGHHAHKHGQRGQSSGNNAPTKASPPQPSAPAPVVAPVQVAEPHPAPVTHTPVTPVKHLVKLSSLSSLSSLISTAAPPAPAHSVHAHAPAPTGSPMSPPSAASEGSPVSSPNSGASSRCSSSLGHGAPVLLPAPYAVPPTYLILDIDETIHVNAHSPCLMMCEKGLEMYQRIISSHANYRQVAYSHKSALTKTLQAALQSKRTVEPETAALLNSLQLASGSNNIRIFGLTARFSHMASTTRKELLKLGIDLEKSSPFPQGVRKRHAAKAGGGGAGGGGSPSPLLSPSPTHERSLTPSPVMCAAVAPLGSSPGGSSMSALQLPASAAPSVPYYPDISWNDHPSFGTDARYQSGVIFTNACEKGPVLSRFLEFLWGQIEEENQEVLIHNQNVLAQHALAVQQYQAALTAVTLHPPSSSRSLDDLAGQLANASHHSPASPTVSHSILALNHAVSNPIPIVGAAASASASVQQSAAAPSPPDSSMAMLAAASQANASKQQGAGASPTQTALHARRTSKTNHLQPPHIGAHASDGASPQSADPHAPASPAQLQSLSLLPTRLIFIDDRLQNCFSVYDSLSAATLFDAYYNNSAKRSRLNHVPSALEVYTCHYVPVELSAPTNQTKADAAATAAANAANAAHAEGAVDLALIEAQIHHFLTHGEILNDSKGRALLARLQAEEDAVKRRMADADATAKSLAVAAALEHQRAAQVAVAAAAAAAAEADRLREMSDVSAAQSSAGSSVSSAGLISSSLMEDCHSDESAPQSQPPTPPSPSLSSSGGSSSGASSSHSNNHSSAASSGDPNAVMAATPRNGPAVA